jgi:gluconate kinase
MDAAPVLLLLGPSGVGKTQLGQWLQEDLGLLWIEADLFGRHNPIDVLGLSQEWNAIRQNDPAPLRDALRARARAQGRSGAVMTLPSVKTIAASKMEKGEAASLHCIILFGSREDCLKAFLEREAALDRGLREDHWERFNSGSFPKFAAADVAQFRMAAFLDGDRRGRVQLVADVRRRLAVG